MNTVIKGSDGVEAWKTNMIQPVKDKYPKPTE